MTTAQIEKRLTAVEDELSRLKAQIAAAPRRKNDWAEAIAGTFANDPIFDDAMRLGREWRQSQRPKPRRRALSKPPSAHRKAMK